jgi:integrase
MLARPLRIGELSRLVLSDVDIARHTITITKSKNKGTRTITIPDVIYEPFRRLVYGLKPKDRVFGMGNISLIHIVNRAMEGAGIERRGRSTHSLRHTAITRLLHEAHVDVAVVAEMAGNTPQTIYRNYNHVPVQAQRDAEKELDKLLSI